MIERRLSDVRQMLMIGRAASKHDSTRFSVWCVLNWFKRTGQGRCDGQTELSGTVVGVSQVHLCVRYVLWECCSHRLKRK